MIYLSISERLEQFLVTEYFFKSFLEVSHIKLSNIKLEQLEFKLKKNIEI